MRKVKAVLLLLTTATIAMSLLAFQMAPQERTKDELRYTTDGQLLRPEQYPKWVHVGSGLGMAYTPAEGEQGDSDPPFTDVYVNPSAYDSFVQTGHWPDKTAMVVAVRQSLTKGSINQAGHYEGSLQAVEVHVKDEARFQGKWGFFGFGPQTKSAKLIPTSADCYSCHADHGAVDTTFVQFYPTLLEIATRQGTVEPDHAAAPAQLKQQKQQNPSSAENNLYARALEAKTAIDPVCQMTIDVDKTVRKSVYKGKTYYFCQDSCKRNFEAAPDKYATEEGH